MKKIIIGIFMVIIAASIIIGGEVIKNNRDNKLYKVIVLRRESRDSGFYGKDYDWVNAGIEQEYTYAELKELAKDHRCSFMLDVTDISGNVRAIRIDHDTAIVIGGVYCDERIKRELIDPTEWTIDLG